MSISTATMMKRIAARRRGGGASLWAVPSCMGMNPATENTKGTEKKMNWACVIAALSRVVAPIREAFINSDLYSFLSVFSVFSVAGLSSTQA
ncbi:MAG: hypothetical protein AB7I32_13145 [Gammaproteobacteria bacterium]